MEWSDNPLEREQTLSRLYFWNTKHKKELFIFFQFFIFLQGRWASSALCCCVVLMTKLLDGALCRELFISLALLAECISSPSRFFLFTWTLRRGTHRAMSASGALWSWLAVWIVFDVGTKCYAELLLLLHSRVRMKSSLLLFRATSTLMVEEKERRRSWWILLTLPLTIITWLAVK